MWQGCAGRFRYSDLAGSRRSTGMGRDWSCGFKPDTCVERVERSWIWTAVSLSNNAHRSTTDGADQSTSAPEGGMTIRPLALLDLFVAIVMVSIWLRISGGELLDVWHNPGYLLACGWQTAS